MDKETFRKLSKGDVVSHKSDIFGIASYMVTDNFGDRVTAVATMDVTNPTEWNLLFKANYNRSTCKNCQDPKPGKLVHVTIEHTKHEGDITRCAYCGRVITIGGQS